MAVSKSIRTPKPSREVLQRSIELKKKKKIGRAVLIALLVVLIISAVVYILVAPAFQIKKIKVQGNSILESTDVSDFVAENISGKLAYIFPQSSVFLYPRKEIEEKLLRKFARISSVQVGLTDWDALLVDLKERETDAVWCRSFNQEISSSTVSNDSSCFFADKAGYVFAESPNFTGSTFIEISGLLADQPIGTKPVPEKTYAVISNFSRYLPDIFSKTAHDNYRLLGVRVADEGTLEALIADTNKPDNGSWTIYFDGEEGADVIAANLYSIIESPAFRKDMLDHKNELASIDLRYGKKVFYKFK